jgi:hypothetical protein
MSNPYVRMLRARRLGSILLSDECEVEPKEWDFATEA